MRWQVVAAILLGVHPAIAQTDSPSGKCASCAVWNTPQTPFRVFGNTYYVGTRELSAVLITSKEGHILLDGALPDSAPQIVQNIRALGFDPKQIKLIVNSHAHFDHAGGIAALQQLSGATVAASPSSAAVLRRGVPSQDDPQRDLDPPSMTKIRDVRVLRDGQALRIGTSTITAHFTGGHTPGGTSWSWKSCEQLRCLNIVYADSLTAVSADTYRFTSHPKLLEKFYKSFAVLEVIPCDILLSAHPGFSGTMRKLQDRESGHQPDAFVDQHSCRDYVSNAREGLTKRIASENAVVDGGRDANR